MDPPETEKCPGVHILYLEAVSETADCLIGFIHAIHIEPTVIAGDFEVPGIAEIP